MDDILVPSIRAKHRSMAGGSDNARFYLMPPAEPAG